MNISIMDNLSPRKGEENQTKRPHFCPLSGFGDCGDHVFFSVAAEEKERGKNAKKEKGECVASGRSAIDTDHATGIARSE